MIEIIQRIHRVALFGLVVAIIGTIVLLSGVFSTYLAGFGYFLEKWTMRLLGYGISMQFVGLVLALLFVRKPRN